MAAIWLAITSPDFDGQNKPQLEGQHVNKVQTPQYPTLLLRAPVGSAGRPPCPLALPRQLTSVAIAGLTDSHSAGGSAPQASSTRSTVHACGGRVDALSVRMRWQRCLLCPPSKSDIISRSTHCDSSSISSVCS